MLSTEHNVTTAQPMIASSISQQELDCGTDILPLSPILLSLSLLEINASMQPTRGKKPSSAHNQRETKRLKYLYNPNSKEVRPNTTVAYFGESDANFLPITSQSLPASIDPTMRLPVYYQQKTTDWHARNIFNLDIDRHSPYRSPTYGSVCVCSGGKYRNKRSVCQVKPQKEYASVEHTNIKILSRSLAGGTPTGQESYPVKAILRIFTLPPGALCRCFVHH